MSTPPDVHDGDKAALKQWHGPYADAFAAGGRVADVGCGPGYFLDLLRERGVHGFGIDLDPAMVEAAKRRGHEAVVGNHTTLASMPDAFTGIHMSHIIDHLWGDEALELLESAKIALKDGGMLIVRTPNWGNAAVRHNGFWLELSHKRPYPKELLEKLLTDLGFETLQSGYEPGAWEDTFVVSRKLAAPSRVAAPGLRFKIDWRGDFLAHHSFARVNRELAKALIATRGVEVVPQGEPTADVEQTLGLPARKAEATSTNLPTFALKHMWPPALLRPQHGYSLHIQPYEYGSVPRSWAEQMPRTVDEVWCPSEYVKKIFTDAGMPADRTFVLPWGVDPAIFHPGVVPTAVGKESTFVFLFVGGAIWRKGIDILLDAYLAEFAPDEDVALVIKAFGSQTFYVNQNAADRAAGLMQRTDVPAVRYNDETLTDEELASLYRRANALVLPYRGEGFGLPVLEAMACGTPPIVTGGGATDDFVNESTGYSMPARREPIGPLSSGDELVHPGWVLEVDQASLRRTMRHAFEHQAEVRQKGKSAAATVRAQYTWAHSAQKALDRLETLSLRPPISRAGEYEPFNAYESKQYSRNGEDGLILELFARLRVSDPFFVEFGVKTGDECTTALLAKTYLWKGVMTEDDGAAFAALRQNYSAYPNVRPVQIRPTRENIAALFAANAVPRDFDLLAIGIGGNGYHLWEAVAEYRARVVIVEYNPAYPPPQQNNDDYGASLTSLTLLAARQGYALIGLESKGASAFFVRRDLLEITGFPERRPEDIFRPSPL
jgi:glycosyltransferase involved in cell wall biosynthesis